MNIEISGNVFEDAQNKYHLTITYGDCKLVIEVPRQEFKMSDKLPEILNQLLHIKNLKLEDKDIHNICAALDLFMSGSYETIKDSSDTQDGIAPSKSINSDDSHILSSVIRTDKLTISSTEIENPNDHPKFHEALETARKDLLINNLSKIVQFANKPNYVFLSKVSNIKSHVESKEDLVMQDTLHQVMHADLYQVYKSESDPEKKQIDAKIQKALLESTTLNLFESTEACKEYLIKNQKNGFYLLEVNGDAGSSRGSCISRYAVSNNDAKELKNDTIYIKEPDYRSIFPSSELNTLTQFVLDELKENNKEINKIDIIKKKKRNFAVGSKKLVDKDAPQSDEMSKPLTIYRNSVVNKSIKTLLDQITILEKYLRFVYNEEEYRPILNGEIYTLAVPISNNNSIVIEINEDTLSFKAINSGKSAIPITEEIFTDFIARLTIQKKNDNTLKNKDVIISQAKRMVFVDQIYQHLMPQGDDDIISGIIEINDTVYYATRSASYSKNPILQDGATKFLELRDIGGKTEYGSKEDGYEGVENIGEKETLTKKIQDIEGKIKEIEEKQKNNLKAKTILIEIEAFEQEIEAFKKEIVGIEKEILEIKKANKILEFKNLEEDLLKLEETKMEEKNIEAEKKRLELKEEIEAIVKKIKEIALETGAKGKKPIATRITEFREILERAKEVEKKIDEVGIKNISQIHTLQPRFNLPPVPMKGLMSNAVLGALFGNNDVNSRNLSVIEEQYRGGRMFNFINIDKKAGLGMFLSDPNSDFFLPFDNSFFRIFSDEKYSNKDYLPLVGIINPQNPRHPYEFQKSIIFDKSNILELFETIYRLEQISDETDIKINPKDKYTAHIAELFNSYLPEDKSAIFYKRFIERKQELIASAKQYLKNIEFVDNDLLLKSSLLAQENEDSNKAMINSLQKPVLQVDAGDKPSVLSYEEYSKFRKEKTAIVTKEVLDITKINKFGTPALITAILSEKFNSDPKIKCEIEKKLKNIFKCVSSMSKNEATSIKNVRKMGLHIYDKLKNKNFDEANAYLSSLSSKYSILEKSYSINKNVTTNENIIVSITKDLMKASDQKVVRPRGISEASDGKEKELSVLEFQILELLCTLNEQHKQKNLFNLNKQKGSLLSKPRITPEKFDKMNDCLNRLSEQTKACILTLSLLNNPTNKTIDVRNALTEFAKKNIIYPEFEEALLKATSLDFKDIITNFNQKPSTNPNSNGAKKLQNNNLSKS